MFEELGLAEFSDADVDDCVRAHGSLDVPAPPSDLAGIASERIMDGGHTALDLVRALFERGYEGEAERVLEMIRQRRGRTRSVAMGHATPRKQMVEGNARRDISAPTLKSGWMKP